MNDWNGNGKYDPADNYMDYKLSGSGEGKSGGTSGGNGGCGWGGHSYYLFFDCPVGGVL